ncbi:MULTISPECIES: DUF5718 family protein [unclassified Campylobacter]|uniref:DUF5718 family protein n=1 Tax=unclassified Campylobacter TaxID=2593542 RepID=UPI001D9F53D6|nr:hypothetical protein [Campylobacter sp. RM9331]MBZ8004970.1 hypothetical protein [Campylobacter sp. RM9332]
MFKDYLCLGVIGNVPNHLNQANEAKDFTELHTSDFAPKGVFPFYSKDSDKEYLKRFCISENELILDGDFVQIEPELCVIFKAFYENDKLSDLKPQFYAAFNDASKRVNENKISSKKNFSTASKGIGNLVPLNNLDELNDYKIHCYLKRDNEIIKYANEDYIKNYFYYSNTLITWLIDTINNQIDIATLEDIRPLISSKPANLLICLGALSYTPFGEKHYLKNNDEIFVAISKNDEFINVKDGSCLHQIVKSNNSSK